MRKINFSDEQLIAKYLSGDEKSFEILIKRYLKPIYSFVYRYVGNVQDAEDITQDIFVKVWRHLKRFNRKKSFKTWIFSIAKNSAVDFIKKKKVLPFSEFDTDNGKNIITDTLADPSPSPYEIIEHRDVARMLTSAVSKLSLKYRLILFLHYNNHLTFKEIAESLGEPLNTVKSRCRRAIFLLKKILGRFQI